MGDKDTPKHSYTSMDFFVSYRDTGAIYDDRAACFNQEVRARILEGRAEVKGFHLVSRTTKVRGRASTSSTSANDARDRGEELKSEVFIKP